MLIGAPVQSGAGRPGCIMGPDAYRTAGLAEMLGSLGHQVEDRGNVAPRQVQVTHGNAAIHHLSETAGWAAALTQAAYDAAAQSDMPIFLGGDHSLSIGTVAGVAKHAADQSQPQFVLWLDAHPDFHTLESTTSGNLHGTPAAYFTGQAGFEAYPDLPATVAPENLCMLGIRSVDPAENAALNDAGVDVHDMRAIDEHGIATPLRAFLERVRDANGRLHVSLDVDFLDPAIAPAVGTTVPGGATFREAHLVMEMLCDSDLVTSLDLVELNPFLDVRGQTARLMVDLTASLMGRKVLDRPTRSF
ncbi:arginase [Nereida sp. MMG025]|uniref:arginase n=1 Tax=Nereida sp. MMG025 TaxID=2909981 RepID=UPI001F0076AD|nr:arginase [Nereida sp. MMG025]MCF6444877.1 arginase [Nereida sp. MMG025]